MASSELSKHCNKFPEANILSSVLALTTYWGKLALVCTMLCWLWLVTNMPSNCITLKWTYMYIILPYSLIIFDIHTHLP